MLKAADVELVLARTICSGKYMVMVRGDVAAVERRSARDARGRFLRNRHFRDPERARIRLPGDQRATKVDTSKRSASWSRSRWRR